VWWCTMPLPSLRAIKYTVIDNKTANINDKNCSLYIVSTPLHLVDILATWWWVISPFYDFRTFWCMVVITVDKLQFLSFIDSYKCEFEWYVEQWNINDWHLNRCVCWFLYFSYSSQCGLTLGKWILISRIFQWLTAFQL